MAEGLAGGEAGGAGGGVHVLPDMPPGVTALAHTRTFHWNPNGNGT